MVFSLLIDRGNSLTNASCLTTNGEALISNASWLSTNGETLVSNASCITTNREVLVNNVSCSSTNRESLVGNTSCSLNKGEALVKNALLLTVIASWPAGWNHSSSFFNQKSGNATPPRCRPNHTEKGSQEGGDGEQKFDIYHGLEPGGKHDLI